MYSFMQESKIHQVMCEMHFTVCRIFNVQDQKVAIQTDVSRPYVGDEASCGQEKNCWSRVIWKVQMSKLCSRMKGHNGRMRKMWRAAHFSSWGEIPGISKQIELRRCWGNRRRMSLRHYATKIKCTDGKEKQYEIFHHCVQEQGRNIATNTREDQNKQL